MTKTRKAPAPRSFESRLGKLADTVLEGVRRVLEALAPRPRLQPVPVRVRSRRTPTRG